MNVHKVFKRKTVYVKKSLNESCNATGEKVMSCLNIRPGIQLNQVNKYPESKPQACKICDALNKKMDVMPIIH